MLSERGTSRAVSPQLLCSLLCEFEESPSRKKPQTKQRRVIKLNKNGVAERGISRPKRTKHCCFEECSNNSTYKVISGSFEERRGRNFFKASAVFRIVLQLSHSVFSRMSEHSPSNSDTAAGNSTARLPSWH